MTVSSGRPVDVLLIGLGSVGTAYAYLLEHSGLARVSAVARSNFDVYAQGQVTIDSQRFGVIKGWKPSRMFKSQEEALADGTRYALGVLATKSVPDVHKNAALLAPSIASGQVAAWNLIQNGLGVETDLYAALQASATRAPLISTAVWTFITTSNAGQHIQWTNAKDATVSGIYAPGRSPTAAEEAALGLWVNLLRTSGHGTLAENRVGVLETTNLLNCVWSSVQTLMGAKHIVLADMDESDVAAVRALALEVVGVGYAAGLLYPGMTLYPSGQVAGTLEDAVQSVFDSVVHAAPGGLLYDYKMSMLVDREAGRPIEAEVIAGSVLAVARAQGIATPLLAYTVALLRGAQRGILSRR
ncbi:hypothetical protein VHUM_02703 [Vanrija humicola]|uniref:2-dehydropantoate 2-reductase n=1 Tax=Vanrija humicola TaxID=5417 RepID=A0A7D8V1J7_VANHU|nr:hypothetical protein VHUM_02703 [Vanrija humicola]